MVDLSVVIPAYNEERKIAADLQAAGAFFREQDLTGEIVVADDGSSDGTAFVAREAPLPDGVPCRVVSLPQHQGKGAAVRAGVGDTRGRTILLADSGSCVPFDQVLPMLVLIREEGAGLVIGSRRRAGAVIDQEQSTLRRLGSRLYMGFLHRLAGLSGAYADTQCGFKLLVGDLGRELFAPCFTDGFMFDLELLLRARRREVKVVEFPIQWRCDPDSRLRPMAAAWSSLREVLRIRRALGGSRGPAEGGDQSRP